MLAGVALANGRSHQLENSLVTILRLYNTVRLQLQNELAEVFPDLLRKWSVFFHVSNLIGGSRCRFSPYCRGIDKRGL